MSDATTLVLGATPKQASFLNKFLCCLLILLVFEFCMFLLECFQWWGAKNGEYTTVGSGDGPKESRTKDEDSIQGKGKSQDESSTQEETCFERSKGFEKASRGFEAKSWCCWRLNWSFIQRLNLIVWPYCFKLYFQIFGGWCGHGLDAVGKEIAFCPHLNFSTKLNAALFYQFCWIKAYSCGWKKAREDNPSDNKGWRTAGWTSKSKCLAELKTAGVKVAQDYTLKNP